MPALARGRGPYPDTCAVDINVLSAFCISFEAPMLSWSKHGPHNRNCNWTANLLATFYSDLHRVRSAGYSPRDFQRNEDLSCMKMATGHARYTSPLAPQCPWASASRRGPSHQSNCVTNCVELHVEPSGRVINFRHVR